MAFSAPAAVLASPYGQLLRKFGTLAASPEHAHQALSSGAALLVYPGGDWEVHRSVLERNKVDFNGRKGFIRLAIDEGVEIGEWHWTGTHTDGTPFAMRGMAALGIESGRIAWGRLYMEPVEHDGRDIDEMVKETYRPPTR